MDALTLDQFAIFVTIVDEGSFAAAARRLGRAQSAITYAIQKLEDQTGVTLFDRSGHRAALTQEGLAMLPQIRRIMDDVGALRLQAKTMTQGIETEITLALDNFLPLAMFTDALAAMRRAFPMMRLRINAAWSQQVENEVTSRRADLGLTFNNQGLGPELDHRVIRSFDLVVVASPRHPLAQIKGTIAQNTLRDHLQIVISNPASDGDTTSFGVVGLNQWRVSEARLRYDLILSGLGWGSMPRPMVEAELANGTLIELVPDRWDSSDRMPRLTCVVAKRKDAALGPGAQFLQDALVRTSPLL